MVIQIFVPLTLNSKPISTLDESRDRRICVTPVALHWACNPVQTVDSLLTQHARAQTLILCNVSKMVMCS